MRAPAWGQWANLASEAGWEPIAYSYGSARPHAVTAAGANTYEYDANGNTLAPGASAGVTCRVEGGVTYIQSYNAENRLSVVTKLLEGTCAAPVKFDMQWDFAYDGDGTRVKQVVSTFDPDTQAITGTSVTSYFMAGLYEETDGVARKYYAISGMTVAMSDAEGMKYLLTDHLGSVTAITDDDGTLLQQQRYKPFGQVRTNVPQPIPDSPITQTDFGYTGQRDITNTGLMDYKARFYDSSIGRFIQPDSIIPNPADPQGWNRLSYVRNNPMRFTDPTGHFIVEEEDCTQLSCSGDPDPGDVKRHRRQRDEFEQLVAGVEQMMRQCLESHGSAGCPPPAPFTIGPVQNVPSSGYSDPSLDALFFWWDHVVRTANDLLASEDLYRFSASGGWKATRNAFSLGLAEAVMQASRQAYRDTWYQGLTPEQRRARVFVVGAEALATDWISGKVGAGFGVAGLSVGGPLGAAGGYFAGATYATNTLDRFWMKTVNPSLFNQLGAWP